MFKKHIANLKTSSPLRSSDRRKFKQRISETYSLSAETSELLVPDGLLSQKFSTHLNELGTAYLSPGGDPLWFSIGRTSEELIPTVYTLWKHPTLLPILSTPAPVVPKLIGGADLMIPGVVQHTSGLECGQVVSITQYHPQNRIGPPIAVGKMVVPSSSLEGEPDIKGKAVFVLHTWKDHLWDIGNGRKTDLPDPREASSPENNESGLKQEDDKAHEIREEHSIHNNTGTNVEAEEDRRTGDVSHTPSETEIIPELVLTPEEASTHLRSALLQALSTTLSSLPPSAFPMAASNFWTSYILPSRQIQVQGERGVAESFAIDIKHSTHKSVKAFLKASAKEGLIKLKDVKGDVVVTAVYGRHPAVASHRLHCTIQSVEARQEKQGQRERKQKETEEKKREELHVLELWKPHQHTLPWFVSACKDTSHLYSRSDIRDIFNTYVSTKELINGRDQQYINVGEDLPLFEAVSIKNEDGPEFLKRDDALKRIKANMQSWHEVQRDGDDPIRKKGSAKPISVVVKLRQGRKAATLFTGFEEYLLNADELTEELRKLCASSTSVAPLPGKTSGMEIMIQGKQTKIVLDLLMSKGVPKKWIESADLTEKKRK